MNLKYDLIVVGGGHAGCEAAAIAAKLGSKVLLISMDMTKFAQMSCNPAMGGIAKGQIVKEIDALGGYSAKVTDLTTIQFRMLNMSKGPAMWSPRAQCDRMRFSMEWRKVLESFSNIDFWQDSVKSLIITNNKVEGVNTELGFRIFSNTVILTTGTFLNGIIYVGQNKTFGGRIAEPNSTGITEQLINYGIQAGRMKTGTPARIDGRSIDFTKLIEQTDESHLYKFSFDDSYKSNLKKLSCYITHTNEDVHKILSQGFNDSPLFDGTITGIGPRYCPSIETKLQTFKEKNSHQLFIEPEGVDTCEYYINGFSSSLPLDIQYKAINKIVGLENAKIFRPGYAIEYDYFPPNQLYHTLESRIIKNLYFAGQINGTTGYEEAAAQGIIAGYNAHLRTFTTDSELFLRRDEAYIGVLIDDLVTKSVDEPYRMFTSRAEYRILLRQDNADARLMPISYKFGGISQNEYNLFVKKNDSINKFINYLSNLSVSPETVNNYLNSKQSSLLKQKTKANSIILRPNILLSELGIVCDSIQNYIVEHNLTTTIIEQTEILIKYRDYIDKEQQIADKINRLEYIDIPKNFDYNKINSLSTEARHKLTKFQPQKIGQASRIPGVSPSDINVLLIFLGR